MKKIAIALIAIGTAVMSGCVAYPQPVPQHQSSGYRDRDRDGVPNRYDRDRDNDGVPNADHRRPGDPRRY